MPEPPTRADVRARAPLWLLHLVRLRPVPVPWSAASRAVFALVVPLAVAVALGRLEWGAVVSAGALAIVLADRDGTYRSRSAHLAAAAAAAIAGYALGVLTAGAAWASAVAVTGLAAVSALISTAGATWSTAGLMLLVFGVIGSGTTLLDIDPWVRLAGFCVGIGWSLVVALVGWTVRGTHHERTAVAQVFVQLAAMLSAPDARTARAVRHQLTVAMNTAYDRLLTARARVPGRDATFRELLTLLSQATPIVEAAVATVDEGVRPPAAVSEHLTRIAAAVLSGVRPPAGHFGDGRPGSLGALYAAVDSLGSGSAREPEPPPSPRERVGELAGALAPDRSSMVAMARLTLCVAIAEMVGALLPFENTYWIALTVGIVLKPELGSIFGRAVLRGLGTVVGVLLAAVVLLTHPPGWFLVALCAVFAAGIPIGKALNYGILSASVTPLIIVQLDVRQFGDAALLVERLVDTTLGCLIVLIAGYWLWPGSTRPRVAARVAKALDDLASYAGLALRPSTSEDDVLRRSRARRRAYRSSADLRGAFGEALVEPTEAGRNAAAWWPVVVTLERVTDGITAVLVAAERDGEWPSELVVEALAARLSELAAAVREDRDPVSGEDIAAGRLSTVFDHLRDVAETVRPVAG